MSRPDSQSVRTCRKIRAFDPVEVLKEDLVILLDRRDPAPSPHLTWASASEKSIPGGLQCGQRPHRRFGVPEGTADVFEVTPIHFSAERDCRQGKARRE